MSEQYRRSSCFLQFDFICQALIFLEIILSLLLFVKKNYALFSLIRLRIVESFVLFVQEV